MTLPKNVLTAEQVRHMYAYDPQTGIITWKNNKNQSFIGRKVGSSVNGDYVRMTISVNGEKHYCLVHRIAWLIHYGQWPKDQLDHINGDRTDNRIANLRECGQAENNANTRLYKNNKSGIKGVYWEKERNTWSAYITENKRLRRLGRFKTKEEAIAVRKQAFADYYHEFCRYE